MTAGLSGPFLCVTAANFLFFLNFTSFFLLPLHVKALGGSEATVGYVMGCSGLASLCALPFIGYAIDRFGRRRFLLFGVLTMCAASAGFLLIDHIGPAMFGLRILQGISFAAAFTASTTLAADLAPPDHRAQALGIFGVSTILTHAIAPTIGEEIVNRGGFPALFAVAASFSAAAALLATRLPAGRASRHALTPPPPWRVGRLQWILIATMALAGIGFGAVITFVPTFVRSIGLGRVGFFFGAYSTAAVSTRVFAGRLSDAFGRRTVLMPALLGLTCSIALLATVTSVPLLILVGILFGLAQGVSYPTQHAFLVDLTAAEHLGRAQALFNGAYNVGVTTSAFIFGRVVEVYGHRVMFVAAACAPAAAWLLLYCFGASGVKRAARGNMVKLAGDGAGLGL